MSSAPVMSSPEVEAILSRPAHLLYPEERYVPVEEYLTSSYRPDMDYVNGHLEVRNLGEVEHSELQAALLTLFRSRALEWNLRVYPECRLQVKADRYRVPDLLILSRALDKPKRIIRSAPLLCIEILSPKDTFARIQDRLVDYVDMGVANVWLFDPKDLGRVLVYRDGLQRWTDERILTIPDSPIQIDLNAIAAEIAD